MEKKGGMEKRRKNERRRRGAVSACLVACWFGVAEAKNDERTTTEKWESRAVGEVCGESDGRSASPLGENFRANVVQLRPGDVLAARWAEEKRNGTPGFWNHLAIVGLDGERVVEAQRVADGVISTPINDFRARYSEIAVFRFIDAETARRAAAFAESRVAVETFPTPGGGPTTLNWEKREGFNEKNGERSGPRYAWGASLAPVFRLDGTAENCVSLVRRAYLAASGVDYRWRIPDDLTRLGEKDGFAEIGRF